MAAQPMNRYELGVTSSGTTNTVIIFSSEGEDTIRKKFSRIDTIRVTRGFIDDAVEGTPIFERNRDGTAVFEGREGALNHLAHHLVNVNPHLKPLEAEEIATGLTNPKHDLTQYGFRQHCWHPLKK